MSVFQTGVDLFAVANNKKHIVAAANTISLSFSRDPLIQWLRPDGLAWEHLDRRTCKWQYRRIQRALFEGTVWQTASVQDIRRANRTTTTTTISSGAAKGTVNISVKDAPPDCEDSGAVVMLFPPKGHLKWSLRRLLLACKVWLLDRIDPAIDQETDDSRLENMMIAHDAGIEKLQKQYKESELWYLEVIAIHPLLQSCGLGKRVMQHVLEQAHGQCVALECTNERNISFYERLGFSIVEEVELSGASKSSPDEADAVKYWLMVRDDKI